MSVYAVNLTPQQEDDWALIHPDATVDDFWTAVLDDLATKAYEKRLGLRALTTDIQEKFTRLDLATKINIAAQLVAAADLEASKK